MADPLGQLAVAVTSVAAEALRMQGKVGTLTPGAWGDLIAVDGDPLRDIRVLERVTGVVKAGRAVSGE